ncbi:MAG TPA: monofunctional biosynthetic peptidoglycan transglycosylase [Gammaproteobacteria bacterium]
MARGTRRPRKQSKKTTRSGTLLGRVVGALGVLTLVWVVATAALVASLRYVDPPVTAMMLQQAVPIRAQKHAWAPRSSISIEAAHAVIASEDQRFLVHNGFDVEQIKRAVETYRAGGDLRGASTITQQVAKNLFLWSGRSFVRKGIEAYFTLLIEAMWPKERILEVYLNVAELGEGIFGVEAAAQTYFGTSAAALGAEQAALLAAVLPNPKVLRVDAPSAYVRSRQAWILGQMRRLRADGHYRELDW